jgi:hypothetical protein
MIRKKIWQRALRDHPVRLFRQTNLSNMQLQAERDAKLDVNWGVNL